MRTLGCSDLFRVMAFGQHTWRESLRDIEACLAANQAKLFHMGLKALPARSTLSDALNQRDWRICHALDHSRFAAMNDPLNTSAQALRALLVRNFDPADLQHELRPPLYDSRGARLANGTAATKFGLSMDNVAPGMRACPYHFHCAQEEAFVVLEGEGTLRVAGEMLALAVGDVVFIPPGAEYPHQIINTSDAPLKYLSISTRDSPEIVVYPDSGK